MEFIFLKWFIPFFIIAFYCLIDGFSFFTSFQKTISYALLLLVIPTIILQLKKESQSSTDFIRLFIVFFVFIIALGLILYFVGFGIVRVVGENRVSGLFGNPNGVGVFSFLTTLFITVSYYFYPGLFPKKWELISYLIILAALFLSSSRGGILSSLVFIGIFFVVTKKQYVPVIISMILLSVFFLLTPDRALTGNDQLHSYLRLEQEDITSGRQVAWKLAKEEINNGNYWLGKGIGYSEYYMLSVSEIAMQRGTVGNVHNSYLSVWLDTGLTGLIFFIFGWLCCIIRYVSDRHGIVFSVLAGVLISTNVESWLISSLSPFTVILLIVFSVIILNQDKKKSYDHSVFIH
jgi:O-antigen ligase